MVLMYVKQGEGPDATAPVDLSTNITEAEKRFEEGNVALGGG